MAGIGPGRRAYATLDDEPVVETLPQDAGYALVDVTDVVPAAPAPFARVAAQVRQDFIVKRARDAAAAVATQILAGTSNGRSLTDAMAVLRQWDLPQPDAFIVDVGTRIMLRSSDGGWREWRDYAASLDRDWNRAAVAAADWLAPLTISDAPPDTRPPSPPTTDRSMAEPKRLKKPLPETLPASPVVPSKPIAGEARLTDAPSGRISRVQIT